MKIRFLRILLLITLFFIPLLGPYQGFGYEKIKVLFFILSTSLIGFFWLFTKTQLKWDLIKIVSLLFLLILFASSGLGLDFKGSFLGKDPYFQGLALYAYLFLFSLLVSTVRIKLEYVAMVLTGSAVVVSLVAIQSWITLNIFNIPVTTYADRVVSTFGQPNFYSGFLLLTLPFSYYLFKQNKLFGTVSGLFAIIGIFVSYSRSAILLSLGLLILASIGQLKIQLKFILTVIVILLVSIFIAVKYQSGLVGNEFSRPFSNFNIDLATQSVEKRAYIWPQALTIVTQRPFLGYGLENIDRSFASYFADNLYLFEGKSKISIILINLKELNIDRSHNYTLDLLLFSGIPGLLVWIALVVVLIRKAKNILLISLITYLVWIQFQNQSIVHLVYFWFLVGLSDQSNNEVLTGHRIV